MTQPVSAPRMYVDIPSPNQTITQNVGITGWALDQMSSSGPGVEAVHAWAYPTNGAAPIFIGASGIGNVRPDVGNYFGARFAGSGFSINGTLPRGDYTLVVFAFSSITRTFNQTVSIHVRVV